MGTKSIVKKAVKSLKSASTSSRAKPSKPSAKTSASKGKKKTTLKQLSKKAASKAPPRKQYEEEPKEKRKKPKRERLTPLPIDEDFNATMIAPKKKLLKKRREAAVIASDAAVFTNPITAYLPSAEEQDRYIASRAIRGQHEGSAALLRDPLEDCGLMGIDFMKAYTEERGDQAKSEEALLQQAHQYFSQLNRDEQRRNTAAMRRLKEMKKVNRAGGDKDGFRYVVPKNVSTVVRQLMVAEGVEGAQVDPESLGSHFGGDGVKETEAKPMRSKKQRNQSFDDFYQFQVAKKWARNAESFLARGRAGKNMFAAKQKQQRSIKKM